MTLTMINVLITCEFCGALERLPIGIAPPVNTEGPEPATVVLPLDALRCLSLGHEIRISR